VIELERRLGRSIAGRAPRAEDRSDGEVRATEFAAIGKLTVLGRGSFVPKLSEPGIYSSDHKTQN
jgi:hypothetical protein